jgi:pilus assembly protein CpaB
MTRPKAVIVVSIFALFFAGVASWLSYSYLQRELSSVKAVQPQRIVVATTDIAVGSTITEAQVKVAAWPKDSIPPGSSQQPVTVVGRIAIRPITGGDAITEQKLKPHSGASGAGFLTYVVPPGHRAVTVAVNEVAGVAGFLTPRDRVDIIVTTQLPNGNRDSVSKIILENVPILATGQVTDQKDGKPAVVPTVTLDLLPSDAEKLVVSASKGPLQLLLRNIADSGHVDSKGATIAKVLTGVEVPAAPSPVVVKAAPPAAPPKPVRTVRPSLPALPPVVVVKAAPPPPTYTLEIVRGTEKSSRQYTE